MQKATTATYATHGKLRLILLEQDEASHTHTPQINQERKQKKKGTSLASSAGVVRVPSARPLRAHGPAAESSGKSSFRGTSSFSPTTPKRTSSVTTTTN